MRKNEREECDTTTHLIKIQVFTSTIVVLLYLAGMKFVCTVWTGVTSSSGAIRDSKDS